MRIALTTCMQTQSNFSLGEFLWTVLTSLEEEGPHTCCYGMTGTEIQGQFSAYTGGTQIV